MPDSAGRRLLELDHELHLLEHVLAVLGWDQETNLPEDGIAERAEQIALLHGLIHDRLVAPELVDLVAAFGSLGGGPLRGEERSLLRVLRRKVDRAARLPRDLVTCLAETTSKAQAAWQEARRDSDYLRFAPHLESVVGLVREVASCVGFTDHPYDALLDEYEPEMRTLRLRSILDELAAGLVPLVRRIAAAPRVDDSFLYGNFPVERQAELGREILGDLGFETRRGRLDVSAHPFATTLGKDDVRITTRYSEREFKTAMYGTIHECGHALYELGFAAEIAGTSLATGTSLGMHESQSRLWENMIGRSRAYCERYFPKIQKAFPSQLAGVSADAFYRAVNRVAPSLIRVEADEVTYNLHIILRFRLELELVSGNLGVTDVPEAWKAQARELLGITPPDDAQGVLQDIHWSMGSIGYFPTYALGNLYAAQLYRGMEQDLGGVEARIEAADFSSILDWLRDRVHRHGAASPAEDLCESVTGSRLSTAPFLDYLNRKYAPIYGL